MNTYNDTLIIQWPASVEDPPEGWHFGAHVGWPGGAGYYLVSDADSTTIIAQQRPDLEVEDALDDQGIQEALLKHERASFSRRVRVVQRLPAKVGDKSAESGVLSTMGSQEFPTSVSGTRKAAQVQVDPAVAKARQLWHRFGTIGFDTYLARVVRDADVYLVQDKPNLAWGDLLG